MVEVDSFSDEYIDDAFEQSFESSNHKIKTKTQTAEIIPESLIEDSFKEVSIDDELDK